MESLAAITSLRSNRPLRNFVLAGAGLMIWSFAAFGFALVAAKGDLTQMNRLPPSRFQVISAYCAPLLGALFAGMLFALPGRADRKSLGGGVGSAAS